MDDAHAIKDWSQMDDAEQAGMILSLFDLTPEQINKIMGEWSTRTYPDTWRGHQTAQAELLALCRWETLSPQQRQAELDRNGIKGEP